MNLHSKIMNIECRQDLPAICAGDNASLAYKIGHRDARHAAAVLAVMADALASAARDFIKTGTDQFCTRGQFTTASQDLSDAITAFDEATA